MHPLLPYAEILSAVLILIVGFGFHFIGQLISVLNWNAAQKLGLQEPDLPSGYYPYEHGTAVADVLIAWVYGVAALGLLLGADWGARLAAIPGAILIYHSLIAWFTENDRRAQGHGVFSNRFRALWCGANFATGALALAVAFWEFPEMEPTIYTWIIALAGLALSAILGGAELIALLRPQADWTVQNIYGGSPDKTDRKAYFAFNQGFAWADVVFWLPLQIAGSIGMLLGTRWGFLLALIASVPFWYSAILIYIWDRDLGFRRNTIGYWLFIWGMFPAFGVAEGAYCLARLL